VSLDALLIVANAVASRRQAKVCLRPLSAYGEDRASRPPSAPAPGPHINGVRPAFAGSSSRRLMRIAPRPFQLRVWRVLGKTRTPCFVDTSSFRLAAPERRYEPLYVAYLRCRSAAANYGLLATPEPFRLTQSPLGAGLLPQALISVGHTPSPEGLSIVLAD
jgi:hypothetical protein